jgi:predicted permease
MPAPRRSDEPSAATGAVVDTTGGGLTPQLPAPPRLARWLVRRSAPGTTREAMLGDLEEEFHGILETDGRRSALRWYWRQALRSLGPNLARRRQLSVTFSRGGGGMDGMTRDLRYALRALLRRPLFSSVIAITLGLGIGANTVILSAVNGMILRPFPFPEPDRVVGVGTAYPRNGQDLGFFENASPAEFEDVRAQATSLEDVVAFDLGNRQIAGDGLPQNVFTAFWWGDPLKTIGMAPFLGRGFTAEEVRTGSPAAMLSHRLWRQRFGADSSMVGGIIAVNGEPHELVGIVPPGVLFYGADLWTVMPVSPSAYARERRQFEILGRVREGSTLAAVNGELETIARRTEATFASALPEYTGWRMEARTWTDISVATLRPAGLVLTGAVGFLLLLVCTNVANMLLSRAQGRRREMAVRTALGAGRGRLLRQLLTESTALALAGGALGLLLAVVGIRGVRALLATVGLPLPGEVRLDAPVLVFSVVVIVATGLLFGLAPALHASRARPGATLRSEGGGATGSRSRQALQRVFVAVEVALALVLLAGGGLLVNTLMRLNRVDPGFDAAHLLTMRLTVPREKYTSDEIQALFQDLSARVEELTGVRHAAAATQVPGVAFSRRNFTAEGTTLVSGAPVPRALATVATRGYFDAVGTPIVRGRGFTPQDGPGGAPVAVLNESAARLLFPGENALGRRIRSGGPDEEERPWFEVVGIAADVHNHGLDQPPEPEVYVAQEQIGGGNQLFLLVRTEGEPGTVLPAIRDVVRAVDPEQPVYAIATAHERYAAANAPRRATAVALGVFSAFALLLAGVGIYAVVSYAVSERTREIGLRMALGAEAGRVRRLVVAQALLPVGVGIGAGLALAMLVGRGLSGLLYGISGTDPATLAIMTVLLFGVAVTASWLPARRASRLDPVRALAIE